MINRCCVNERSKWEVISAYPEGACRADSQTRVSKGSVTIQIMVMPSRPYNFVGYWLNGRWFLQIVDIHVGNLNMKLTGRWFPQIVDRDSVVLVSEPVRGRSRATELPCFFKNVHGVLKRTKKNKKNGGGGILGCLGHPTPPPGGRVGRKTMHFFL